MKKEMDSQKWLTNKLLKAKDFISSTELLSLDDCPYKRGSSLRKDVNLLRQQNIPVLASKRGYMIRYDRQLIIEQIMSLKNRVDVINASIDGLYYLLKMLDEVEEVDFFKEEGA
jgi:hypothetical protein